MRAAAVTWGERGARVNCISPGIIATPLARDEMSGPNAAGYRHMIDTSAADRMGTPSDVADAAALLLGPNGSFITGSDLLIDGGVIAARFAAEHAKTTAEEREDEDYEKPAAGRRHDRTGDHRAPGRGHRSDRTRRRRHRPRARPASPALTRDLDRAQHLLPGADVGKGDLDGACDPPTLLVEDVPSDLRRGSQRS